MKRNLIPAGLSSAAALAAALGLMWSFDAGGWRSGLRDNALDLQLAAASDGPTPVKIVDIDSAALQRYGPWPWSRAMLARLVRAIAAADPLMVGLDMLLAGDDRLSPSAVARRLAAETARSDLAAIASELPDGDAELARALAETHGVLGAVLAADGAPAAQPAAPILVRGAPRLPRIWRAPAAIWPLAALAQAAEGVGLIVFENDPDGVVRRTPLLALAGREPLPGFAVEAARVAAGASTLIVDDAPPRLRIGDRAVPLGPDASLHIRASTPDAWTARTLSAARLMEGGADAAGLQGAMVLIGSSAPEVGIFRRTAAAEVAPAVQIEADAVATLLSDQIPWRPAGLGPVETAAALALGALALAAGFGLRPARGLAVVAAAAAAWALAAALLLRWRGLLLDPAGPPAVAVLTFTLAALIAAVATEQRERRLRRRFEQHLAPAIVARILAQPGGLRLEGEAREVTAMFTDIEGFTAMTERSQPRALIALLDGYFQMLAEIVVAHGGMVDKIVGDGIHALFNAPLDLPDHSLQAVRCAIALRDASAAFRERPEARALGLGRTRIGLETGPVIIGDVGGGRKLDYTAHGTAVNTASRLEAANKELGTTICIGPVAAARLPQGWVRSVATMKIRGRKDEIEIFEPQPQ